MQRNILIFDEVNGYEKLKKLETHNSHRLTNFTLVGENIYIYFREAGTEFPALPPPVKQVRSIVKELRNQVTPFAVVQ